MKKSTLTLVIFLLASASTFAQFYSGKFNSKPQLEDFEHFIVMQHAHHDKYGGDLTVKAFVKSGELWHSKATLVEPEIAAEFIKNFGQNLDILSVYKMSIALDGEDWEYYMLGFKSKDRKHKGDFIIVEEIYHNISDVHPVEVNAFQWDRTTARVN